jgi:hypothetical protein
MNRKDKEEQKTQEQVVQQTKKTEERTSQKDEVIHLTARPPKTIITLSDRVIVQHSEMEKAKEKS